MIPNIVYAVRCRNNKIEKQNKFIEALEQIGRFGCMIFMIINVPYTWFGWWSDEAFAVYLIVDIVLALLYCALWVVLWKKDGVFKALALSIIPSAIFLFSGIMSRSVPLIVSALIFAPTHIFISYKNAE